MKKIFLISAAAVMALSTVSCVNEIEDVFPVSSSERLSQKERECLDLLLSSPQGWLIQYYPASTREFGGCTFAAVFNDDGSVTVTSEQAADASVTVTSHYSINTSSSVVLTFDTYNSYIHAWSDPDIYGQNYFDGDFEFAFESGDRHQLIFRAVKTGNRTVFTALDENMDIVSAIEQVQDMKNQYFISYDVYGEVVEANSSGYNCLTYHQLHTGEGSSYYSYQEIPFAYSLDGITLYEPFELNGMSVQNFVWNAETETYVSSDAVDRYGNPLTIEAKGQRHPYFIPYEGYLGTYTFSTSAGTYELEFAPSGDGSTYTVSEIEGFSFTVGWTPSGYLTLNAQYVGTYGQYYIWICPWDSNSGYLTWSTSVGLNLVNESNDPDNISFTFEDNGVWGTYTANAILLYAFTSQTASNGTAAGSLAQIVPYSLVKNN